MTLSGGDFNHPDIDRLDAAIQAGGYIPMTEAAPGPWANRVLGFTVGPFTGNGGPTSTTGKFTTGLQFVRATGQSIDATGSGEFTRGSNYFVMSVWIKLDSIGTARTIFWESTGNAASTLRCIISINASNHLAMAMRDTLAGAVRSAESTLTLTDTVSFHNVVVAYDIPNNKMLGYIDGVEFINASVTMGAFHDSVSVSGPFIGEANGIATLEFDGRMSDMGLWDFKPGALTPVEAEIVLFKDAMWNGGTGRAWAIDTTAPSVGDRVTLNRYNDSSAETRQVLTWRNPTDLDLLGAQVGRALDSTASAPTDILRINTNGTLNFNTSGIIAVLAGVNAAQGPPMPAEGDRYGVIMDPDQADVESAFFTRWLDVAGNLTAWVKATVVIGDVVLRLPVGLTVKNVNKITLATRLVNP